MAINMHILYVSMVPLPWLHLQYTYVARVFAIFWRDFVQDRGVYLTLSEEEYYFIQPKPRGLIHVLGDYSDWSKLPTDMRMAMRS